jgi:RNA polymerase sigma-70 factor, ECF subfamily
VEPRGDADVAMEQYAAGNAAAFGKVYDVLAPRLFPFLLRQTRDRARAEDLLQQTMLRLHRARDQFIPGAQVVPWAFAIARRLLVDSLRRDRREVVGDGTDPDGGIAVAPGPDEFVHASEIARRIERTLAGLPESQRTAFQLTKHDGLTLAEAAQVLGVTVTAVKLRVHRAYEALRADLGEFGVAEPEGGDRQDAAKACLGPEGLKP